jgi:ABC-type sulfate transport system substrate-binding protein
MRLHAEKGTNSKFSQEEASRVADVLGQWVSVVRDFFTSGLCLIFV